MITTLDLFAGIGGFSLGLEATDFFRTTCFVENEPYCQAVLKHHWPDVPVLGDIRDVRREDLPDPNPGLICGGFPCQPFSQAGKRRAQDDPRHLWPHMLRLIRECSPTWVVGENVAGLINLGLDEVLSDLEDEGYATRTFNIPACAVGAPHLRQRLWIVAHSDSESEPDGHGQLGFGFMADAKSAGSQARGCDGVGTTNRSRRNKVQSAGTSSKTDVADADSSTQWHGQSGENWWTVEPDVGRVAHGIPNRVSQLRSLGNSIIPQIAQEIGKAIHEAETEQ